MNRERWQRVKGLFESLLDLPEAVREAQLRREAVGDDDLRHEVNSLLRAHVAAPAGFLNPSPPEPQTSGVAAGAADSRTGQTIGAYRLLGELGHGGMGIVYRACRDDGQYAKEVALKLVRAGAGTAGVLERFRTERQILASLEHPNIARLFDGGTTEDGLPYLVMELVDGVPIDSYCDANRLSVEARLMLFRQVCAAVQYAHGHLIAHRDIKPNNILVARDGTPKLLDFGIAKLLDAGSEHRATQFAPMTPEYASPEQIRGESVTAASDVYSLGVVLYRVLTGVSPFERQRNSAHELARSICEREPTPPSQTDGWPRDPAHKTLGLGDESGDAPPRIETMQRRRRLRGDLDAIVLRALRKEPARRYASVEQLSEDIRRHLERLPVLARRGSRAYRARRFVARHRFGLAAAFTIVLAVSAGVLATLRQADIARSNAARAERRFADVRNLATSFLFEFHDSIERLPGSTPSRKLIVTRALEYLDGLSAEAANDLALKRELGAAYEKLGDVQGSPYRSNIGDYRGALMSYQKALALRESLDRRAFEAQLALARLHGKVGELSLVSGDPAAAKLHYDQERVMLAGNLARSAEFRQELATLEMRNGKLDLRHHEVERALVHDRNAISLLDTLLRERPDDRKLIRSRAVAGVHLGDVYDVAARLPEALAAHRAALLLFTPLVQSSDAQSLRDAALATARIGDILAKLGDRRQALDLQLKATAEDELAARVDPADAQARRDVYIDYFKVANLQADLGRVSMALATQRECIARVEREVTAVPSSTEIRGDRAEAYGFLATLQRRSGERSAATDSLQRSLAMYEALLQATPDDESRREDISRTLAELGDVYAEEADLHRALDAYTRALAVRERAPAANPDDPAARSAEATLYGRLGRVHARVAAGGPASTGAAEWQEAERCYRRALDLWSALEEQQALGANFAAEQVAAKRGWQSASARRPVAHAS